MFGLDGRYDFSSIERKCICGSTNYSPEVGGRETPVSDFFSNVKAIYERNDTA